MKFEAKQFFDELPHAPDARWPDGVPFTEVFARHDLTLEFFKPGGLDYQTPHERDEIYVVASGEAALVIEGEEFSCRAGDALFVKMRARHRFERMSADFATWVIFFGPEST